MSPFGKLFWGFLIAFIDIRINGFDLLVDLVGWVLIVVGLGELAQRNPRFRRARPYATVLLILSALDLFSRSPAGSSRIEVFGSTELAIAFFVSVLVISLMFVYLICRGVREMALEANQVHLADLAMTRWVFFLATYVLTTLLVIGAAADEDLSLLAIVAVIASFVAAILIAALLYRADKTFYPRGS